MNAPGSSSPLSWSSSDSSLSSRSGSLSSERSLGSSSALVSSFSSESSQSTAGSSPLFESKSSIGSSSSSSPLLDAAATSAVSLADLSARVDGAYLFHNAAGTFCAARPVVAEEQARLESLVFSKSFKPSSVIQTSPHVIKVYNYELIADINMLGSGSYGNVFLFEDVSKGVYLAIKYSDRDDEGEISTALLRSGCRVLREQPVGKMLIDPSNNSSRYAYFMELAEGTLVKFVNTLLLENQNVPLSLSNQDLVTIFINIGEELRYQMLCLYDLNSQYVYTDLKATNVLFKCDSQVMRNTVRFFLGDLGGAVPNPDNGTYISTYPCPEQRARGGILYLPTPFDKEAAMSWQLGVLLLYLVAYNLPQFREFEYKNITSLSAQTYQLLYNRMRAFYGSDLALLLHSNPTKRRDIRRSLIPV